MLFPERNRRANLSKHKPHKYKRPLNAVVLYLPISPNRLFNITRLHFLSDLHDIIKKYDDLSDGEMKFIRQLNLTNQVEAVAALKDKFSVHYLDTIKNRADGVDRASEIIMFTEDLRK